MSKELELKFAKGLTSLTAVMVPMLIVIAGNSIAGAHLVYHSFPDSMMEEAKIPASMLIGLAIAMALISVSTNKDILPAWNARHEWIGFPLMLAVFSAFLLAFFFELFEQWDQLAIHEIVKYIFLSVFIAYLEFTFVYLFVKKLQQVRNTIKFETKIKKLNVTISQLEETKTQLSATIDKLKPTEEQLKETTSELDKLRLDLTCKKCGKQKNARSIASHESKCHG